MTGKKLKHGEVMVAMAVGRARDGILQRQNTWQRADPEIVEALESVPWKFALAVSGATTGLCGRYYQIK